MLLTGCPRVGAIAVGIGHEFHGSLLGCDPADALGTYKVEVALALAAELHVTLVEDIVEGDVGEGLKSCTGTNLVHITGSL